MGQLSPEPSCDFGFEFVIAQTERLTRPEERATAEEPHPHPVIGMCRVVGVGNLLFVDPGVGVEFVGLKDVGQPAGLFESAKGQG